MMMFRANPRMLSFAMAMVCLLGGRLAAAETVQEPKSPQQEKNTSFERRQFTTSRSKGEIVIDGTVTPRHVLELKSKELRLIETFDGLSFPSDRHFLQWAHKLKGPRTYTYDEVTLVSEDGTTITQPLVFFENEQRTELDTKWHVWLVNRQAEIEKANRILLTKEQEARRYQQQSNLQTLQAQVLSAQAAAVDRSAESLAVISGATSLWEVELIPAGNYGSCSSCTPNSSGLFYGTHAAGLTFFVNGSNLNSAFRINDNTSNVSPPLYVKAYGRTSQMASDQALKSHSGYRVSSIRKLAGN